jgi:hypothetical protein
MNLGCGGGPWIRSGRSCVAPYRDPARNWTDAHSFCQSQGGDLLRFDTKTDAVSVFFCLFCFVCFLLFFVCLLWVFSCFFFFFKFSKVLPLLRYWHVLSNKVLSPCFAVTFYLMLCAGLGGYAGIQGNRLKVFKMLFYTF